MASDILPRASAKICANVPKSSQRVADSIESKL
jgi:hypothetical protein